MERATETDPVPSGELTYSLFESNVQSPFIVTGLTAGAVYAFKTKARNLVGYSELSDPVSILAAQTPGPPVNLANVEAITTSTQVGLSWQVPAFTGGSALIDYRLFTDSATGGVTFTEVAAGLTALEYTVTSTTQGLTYQFKVEARNQYGYSFFSNTVSILSSQNPQRPLAPVTSWSPDDVTITWQKPDNGGSPILSYTIYIR